MSKSFAYCLFIAFFWLVGITSIQSQSRYIDDPGVRNSYMLNQINNLRSKGCKCGRKRMKSVPRLQWNKTLAYSAYTYAQQMHQYNFFAHRSIEGKDIGDRLDDLEYKWQYAGENLAEGQKTFESAFEDWLASPTHCEMLMNPNMTEMGLAKYGKYWVHHLAAPMPKNTRRIRTRYKEGE